MTAKARYRLFHPLLDTCFWIQAIHTVVVAGRSLGLHSIESNSYWSYFSAGTWIVSWLILMFLCLSSLLRDEFAEKLWQKAASSFAKLVFILPFLLAIMVETAEGSIIEYFKIVEHFVPSTTYNVRTATGIVHDHSIGGVGYNEYVGALYVLISMAKYTPVIFAGLIKWHRWREA